MAYRKDKFVSGRGRFNREAQPDVLTTHWYEPSADTVTDLKTPGYFDGATEFLLLGDLVWVANPEANPYQLTVSSLGPVEVQEIQLPTAGAVLTTFGGAAVESFGGGIPSTSIPNVTINTTAVGGLTVVKTAIVSNKVEVTFSADPGAATTINLMVFPAII